TLLKIFRGCVQLALAIFASFSTLFRICPFFQRKKSLFRSEKGIGNVPGGCGSVYFILFYVKRSAAEMGDRSAFL
ncbi:MAG: hypothetical protein LUF81_07650, partial [Clostridiales bacterium]|nr:hypothetical protein [Clostridiales bacterium]